MTATLNARADAFAQDFDRELTLAYMLFQVDPGLPASPPTRVSRRGSPAATIAGRRRRAIRS